MAFIKMTVPLKGLSTGRSTVKIETSGFSGVACKSATEFLEQSLGKVVADEATNEMYEAAEEAVEKVKSE